MLKTLMTATAISALMISGALAQATQPAPTAPHATAPMTGNFIAMQKADQWLASKFMGTDVIGPNNEAVGDVNDVLFDRNGNIAALIVGVGGFLGIGEKNVALEMSAFQVVPASGNTAATADDPNNVKLKVSLTKDQLKQAPQFEAYKAPARTTGNPAPANTGTRPATPSPAR